MSDIRETISDKLRSWSNKEEHCFPLEAALREFEIEKTPGWDDLRNVFRRIADEIDAEKREITEGYARQSWMNPADAIAKLAKGEIEWSELEEAIDRYFLRKPLGDDGEPVQLGDTVVDKLRGEVLVTRMSWVGKGVYFNDSHNRSGKKLRTSRIAYAPGERVRRPEPQVLDADGVPIEVGDTVYWRSSCTKRWYEHTVSRIGQVPESVREEYPDVAHAVYFGERSWMPNDRLTHREPDSQERIDRDALKNEYLYWGCTGSECLNCPALMDGKKPKEFYGVDWCKNATRLDLLRRQRELDGRDT